jgi:uncharacterized protein YkwD/glutaredoxin
MTIFSKLFLTNIYTMQFIKFSVVLVFITFCSLSASAQGNINDAIFFKAKYKKDKVWDVQRSPAFPVAGQNWRLSGLKGSLDARGTTVDWGQDRYVMLVAEPDNSNSANSLTNDVTGAGGKYKVALKLFESNGTLVRVVSSWGKIAGIGDKGFMYECEGQFGTFFSVAAVQQSAVIEYRPTLGVISRLSEIINPSDLTRSLEREYLVTESSFFSNKYVKDNVWDVQRSPAYPVAGQEWRLSGLKGSLDASGASVNWGNGRYVMLIAEADNTNNPNSLIDDINNTGTKLNISLKLYESNGALVQVVSKWGKIYGMGAEGFMYEVEGRFGTFFSVARVNASDVLRYRPNLGAITKLSELTKGLNAVKVSEPISVSSNPFSNAAFFNTKHTKEKVWDAQREPAFPVIGQDWTLKGLKPAMDASGARIDWGSGRYVMFVAEPDNARWANSVVDDVNKSGVKYNIALKLYESNGTLVKEISKWGRVIGIGDRGFMYETEGRYGTFFSVGGANAATVIRYKPSIASVVKLSQLLGGEVKVSENVNVNPVNSVTDGPTVTNNTNNPPTGVPDNNATRKIEVYTMVGCPNCTYAIKYLQNNKIPFTEFNTNEAANNSKMWTALSKSGKFKGGSIGMPVIVVDGDVNFSIPNLAGFMANLSNNQNANNQTNNNNAANNAANNLSFTDVTEGNLTILRSEALIAFNQLNKVRKNPSGYSSQYGVDLSGVAPRANVVWNATLMKAAEDKAKDMATRNYFAHTDPDGNGMNIKIHNAGYTLTPNFLKNKTDNFFESIAMGFPDGLSVIKGLIVDEGVPSLGHRKHLLGMTDFHANCFDFGIGIVRVGGKTYTSVLIAKRDF